MISNKSEKKFSGPISKNCLCFSLLLGIIEMGFKRQFHCLFVCILTTQPASMGCSKTGLLFLIVDHAICIQ